jgi:putative endonuclease
MAAKRRPAGPSWQVYILRCGDMSLYTGIARDALARLAQHEAGRGARYTRGRGPLELVYLEEAASHGEALRREAAIRRLGRAGKERLVALSLTPSAPPRAFDRRSPPRTLPKAPPRRRRGAPGGGC